MNLRFTFTTIIVAIAAATCSTLAQINIESAFPNLSFNRPVDIQHAGDGSGRLFVVEQDGRILVFDNTSGVSTTDVFLDIRQKVLRGGNEEGLLGLAFHPDFESNGYFYVNHSAANPRRNVIARYTVPATDPNSAEPNSEFVILEFEQPYSNHNGGQLAFGPDGYLYIATGDGGAGGDPMGNGQDRSTLLGNILRIDVDTQDAGLNYAIPADNPYAGNTGGYREEIWAYGLRNPWRFSFDPETGRLWAGDVGQNAYEEIDIIEKGGNYGWNIMEGFHCFSPPSGCDQTGLELPVVEYDHSLGASVTGGHVYHGNSAPELDGLYVYADFGSGRIWTIDYDPQTEPVNALLANTGETVSTFGVDETGELYFASFGGSLFKFVSTGTGMNALPPSGQRFRIESVYPNPAGKDAHSLYVDVHTAAAGSIGVDLYDHLGRLRRSSAPVGLGPGRHTIPVTLAGMPAGTYHLVMKGGDGARRSKVVQIF